MRRRSVPVAILAAFGIALCAAGIDVPKTDTAGPKPPSLDKPKLEAYLRYAEAYGPQVRIAIDDLSPGPISGYYRALVHLSRDKAKLERTYYTPDGEHFINGAVWDLNSSPFVDTLQRLPTKGFSFGPAAAKVTIVVFSDFECPYCRELASTIRENIPQEYPQDVRVLFEDFPLEQIHPWARKAAEGGRCLGQQKEQAFWAWHDWIFQHQHDITEANLRDTAVRIAQEQQLDVAKVSSCVANNLILAAHPADDGPNLR